MTTEQDLRAVLELSERATPGEWRTRMVDPQQWALDCDFHVSGAGHWSGMADVYGCDDFPENGARVSEANAALIAAAVNLIRTHGPALLRAVEDARRYRFLRDKCDHIAVGCHIQFSTQRNDLDAAIDAAIAEGEW